VVEAGADGVAVISALVAKGERTRAIVEELLGILEG
jgi:thiamine monophosphate synthase